MKNQNWQKRKPLITLADENGFGVCAADGSILEFPSEEEAEKAAEEKTNSNPEHNYTVILVY